MIALLFTGLLAAASLQQSDAQVGVCYGLLGDNLPPPEEVVSLFKQNNITRIRLYDPNQAALRALRGKNIEVMVGLPNIDLEGIAASQANADSWLQRNIKDYLPYVKFRYIVVGNEISPSNYNSQFSRFLYKAMQNIQRAVSEAGLELQIKVSTSFDMSILGNSFPPSEGSFMPRTRAMFLDPILNLLSANNASLLANIYPYFAHATNIKDVRLDYALFTSSTNVVTDGKLGYQNLFDAMLDAVYSALENAGHDSIEIVVSETGWPSAGGASTSVDNERIYNTNLLQHVKKGTPKRPGKPVEAYVFAMFDENQKDGPEVERHWGLFSPNKEMKFPLMFQ